MPQEAPVLQNGPHPSPGATLRPRGIGSAPSASSVNRHPVDTDMRNAGVRPLHASNFQQPQSLPGSPTVGRNVEVPYRAPAKSDSSTVVHRSSSNEERNAEQAHSRSPSTDRPSQMSNWNPPTAGNTGNVSPQNNYDTNIRDHGEPFTASTFLQAILDKIYLLLFFLMFDVSNVKLPCVLRSPAS